MNNQQVTKGLGSNELRLLARGVGLLAALTAVLYLRAILGGGYLGETAVSSTTLLFVVMLVATAGLVVAWRWEGIGGALAVVGAVAVAAVVYVTVADNQLIAMFVYSSPFIVSGGLYLVDWLKHRN